MKSLHYSYKYFTCLLMIFLFLCNTTVLSTPQNVAEDTLINLVQWSVSESGNDHWYGIIPIVQDWNDHKALSETYSLFGEPGHLVTIKSLEENQFIFDSILVGNTGQPSITDEFYIGGTTDNGWLTGEPMTYTNWDVWEPNGDGIAIAIWGASQGSKAGTWNDVPPDDIEGDIHRLWAIVEFGVDSSLYVNNILNLVRWSELEGGNNHLYGIIPIVQDWYDHKDTSESYYINGQAGHLVTVNSEEENQFIFDYILTGNTNQPSITDEFYLGGTTTNGWVTGEPMDYTNWNTNEPNGDGIGIAIWGASQGAIAGTWNDVPPDDIVGSIHRLWAIIEFDSNDCCLYSRGNIDFDMYDLIDVSDLVYLVDFMFTGGVEPPCLEEANIDGDISSIIDISDLVYLVDFMFTGGPVPQPCQ